MLKETVLVDVEAPEDKVLPHVAARLRHPVVSCDGGISASAWHAMRQGGAIAEKNKGGQSFIQLEIVNGEESMHLRARKRKTVAT